MILWEQVQPLDVWQSVLYSLLDTTVKKCQIKLTSLFEMYLFLSTSRLWLVTWP